MIKGQTVTERLILTPPAAADLDALHELHADAAVWAHFPSGRHVDRAQTESLVQRWRDGWLANGLDVWVARTRAAGEVGAFVGVGGCSLREDFGWNLYYRLCPRAWGKGYAQEIVAAGRTAAARVRPDLPVIAYLLEHNTRSKRAAERAGLQLVWRGPDAGSPDPDAVRLIYADRPVQQHTLDALVRR